MYSLGAMTTKIYATLPVKGRDLRLDLFRGVANWGIFLDHIPNNIVNWVRTRHYGFSDAADLMSLGALFVHRWNARLKFAASLKPSAKAISSLASVVLRRYFRAIWVRSSSCRPRKEKPCWRSWRRNDRSLAPSSFAMASKVGGLAMSRSRTARIFPATPIRNLRSPSKSSHKATMVGYVVLLPRSALRSSQCDSKRI